MKKTKRILALFGLVFLFAVFANTALAAIILTDAEAVCEEGLSRESISTTQSPIKTVFIFNADTASEENLFSINIPTSISSLKEIFIHLEDAMHFEELIIPQEYESIPIFDTGASENPYPSISGTHTGKIKPNHDVNVTKMYTYSCSGTGGHSKYVRIHGESLDVNATWGSYQSGDYHYITFDDSFTLKANVTYNYTIITSSYPQIHHTHNLSTPAGFITCSEFRDTNGKRYSDWIPAIRLA